MNRIEYLSRLDNLLKCLPEQERREAVEFYYTYFEDAKENGKSDEDVIREIGPLEKVVERIKKENNYQAKSAASKEAFQQASSSSSVFKGVKGVFLAIGAVIIGLPGAVIIGIPVLAVLLSLLVAAVAVIFALGVVLVVVPIALIVSSVALFATAGIFGITSVGWGLLLLGAALLLATVVYALIYLIIKGISAAAAALMRSFEKRRGRKAAER